LFIHQTRIEMKYSIVIAIVTLSLFSACNSGHNHSQQGNQPSEQPSQQEGPEYTSAYICPMHCPGSGSDQPGKCPVCDMDYVANDDQDSHEGHNH
jgi:hypothetical protein